MVRSGRQGDAGNDAPDRRGRRGDGPAPPRSRRVVDGGGHPCRAGAPRGRRAALVRRGKPARQRGDQVRRPPAGRPHRHLHPEPGKPGPLRHPYRLLQFHARDRLGAHRPGTAPARRLALAVFRLRPLRLVRHQDPRAQGRGEGFPAGGGGKGGSAGPRGDGRGPGADRRYHHHQDAGFHQRPAGRRRRLPRGEIPRPDGPLRGRFESAAPREPALLPRGRDARLPAVGHPPVHPPRRSAHAGVRPAAHRLRRRRHPLAAGRGGRLPQRADLLRGLAVRGRTQRRGGDGARVRPAHAFRAPAFVQPAAGRRLRGGAAHRRTREPGGAGAHLRARRPQPADAGGPRQDDPGRRKGRL